MVFGAGLRRFLATLGLLLWLIYPLAFFKGVGLRHEARCEGRVYAGAFDDCFNDYIPVAEILWAAIALLLVFFFAKFAYSLYSRPGDRNLWRFTKPWSGQGWSFRQALSIAGIVWTFWNVASLPWRTPYLGWLHIYWLAFFSWFAVSAWLNRPTVVDAALDELDRG